MKKIDLNEIKIGTKIKYRHPYVKNAILNGCIAVIHKTIHETITATAHNKRTSVWFEDEFSGYDNHYVGNKINSNQIIEIVEDEKET